MGEPVSIQEKVASKKTRPVYVFDVPPGIGGDVSSIGVLELTASEEMMAMKRSAGDAARVAQELAKQALVEVGGQTVSLKDGSADKAFNEMHPKLRSLVIRAYAEINGAQEEDAEVFLQSRRVKV